MATAYEKNHVPHGHDFEKGWREGKRVTSSGYYNRYFSYGVPKGDISDVQLENFFKNLPELDKDGISRQLLDWLEDQSTTTLIQKLRVNVDKVSGNEASRLALSPAEMAERFPEDGGGFALVATFEQAALYVSELVKRLPGEMTRVDLGKQIVLASNPLVFAVSVLRWVSPRDDETSEAVLSKESVETLFDVAAGRVESLIGGLEEPIYIDTNTEKHATAYLSVLAQTKGKETSTRYLVSTFEKDATNALKFLYRYASSWTDMSTGKRIVRNITTETFGTISRVIDAGTLLEWLQRALGENLTVEDVPNYITGYVEEFTNLKDAERELACQFAFHLAEQAQTPDNDDSDDLDRLSS